MNRKDFLKQCGFACLSTSVAFLFLESCATHKTIKGQLVDSDLSIPIDSFLTGKKEKEKHRKYLIVAHDQLKYPIYIFRFSDTEYKAMLMKCTHQGAELQAFGDVLQCPAHGSEFNNSGHVQNGPANENLRTFPVSIINNQIKISLKNA